jgi:two-component system sensor histidine kinase UhpB
VGIIAATVSFVPLSTSAHVDALFDGSVSCVVLLDRAFNFIRVNQAYAAACGRALEDFEGRNHFDLYPSDARAIFEQVVASGRPYRAAARPFLFPDAPERGMTYWDLALTPIVDEQGDVEFLLLSLSDVTDHVLTRHRLEESEAQLRALAGSLQARLEAERAHLARELHDELGQALTVVRLGLMSAAVDCAECPRSEAVTAPVRTMMRRIDEAAHTVQRLTTWLRPAMLDESGLIAAVEAEAASWQSYGRLRCRVRGTLPPGCLEPALDIALFRIVQEALTNVVRHAEASLAVVSCRVVGRSVVITIRDNGRGVDARVSTRRNALGLAGMRERAVLAGGAFDVRRRRRRGTVVTVSVPLRGERQAPL